MRVLVVTVSIIFAAACTDDRTAATQNSDGHGHDGGDGGGGGDHGDGGGGGDGGMPCGTSDAPIVFAAMLDGQAATDLYVLRGGPAMRLTNTPGAELWPAWSPDRLEVAFVRDAQLYVLDVHSGSERLVAEHVGRRREVSGAAWSPDGTRLVYPYPRDAYIIERDPVEGPIDESYDTTLHFVNADGTNDAAYNEPLDPSLPPGIGTLGEPAWSSTDLIAFTVSDDCPDCAGGSRYAYSNPDGTGYRDVTPGDLGEYPLYPRHGLDWSPDGTRWVFTAMAQEPNEAPGVIATRSVANPDDIQQLTPPGAWYPRYAPSGDFIAFLRSDGIYVMNANGTGNHRIQSAAGVRGLDW
jgi:Tol biopolymer transport system component